MSFMAPLAQAIGAGINAAGTLQAGAAQQRVDQFNARVSNQNSVQALLAGQTNAQIVDQQTSERIGAAAAAYGGSGVTLSGSPLAVMASLASKGEMNRQLALYQGQAAAAADKAQAGISSAQGDATMQGATTKAYATLLTGTATFGNAVTSMFPGTSGAGTSTLPASG